MLGLILDGFIFPYLLLAAIRLHMYDLFFRFILLLLDSANIRPGPATVSDNSIPLNTLPYLNCDVSNVPSERDSSNWNKAKRFETEDSWKKGFHILHLNINSLILKSNEVRHTAKQSNASIIGISESTLDFSILNSELDIENYNLIRIDHSRKESGFAFYIIKSLSSSQKQNFCRDIEIIL